MSNKTIETYTILSPESEMPWAMPRLSLERHYRADSDLKGDTSRLSCNTCIQGLELISLSAC